MAKVGFIGLGAMGFGMAGHLIEAGVQVMGYDVHAPCFQRLVQRGGLSAPSPRQIAATNKIMLFMVANSKQLESAIFDAESGALNNLTRQALIIVCSTVSAVSVQSIRDRLNACGRSDVMLVDAPVSGGTLKAAKGQLSIFASGNEDALAAAEPILLLLSQKLHIIPGGLGSASHVKMINQLLAGIHIAASAEAMALAAKAGLDTRKVFDIIVNAAGNSWMFENRVPHMLQDDWHPHSALDIFVKDMGIITSTARGYNFPVPLSSAAEQLYLAGSASGLGGEDDAGLVRLYLPRDTKAVHRMAGSMQALPWTTPPTTPLEIKKVGFIGLGAMGIGMAVSLIKAGYPVCGFDKYAPSTEKFTASGGKVSESPEVTAEGSQILILMVQNQQQARDVLFGAGKAAGTLPSGAVVIIMSTIAPSAMREIGEQLESLGRGIVLIDAPVSGGVVRAAKGELTIISSGQEQALEKARPILAAMSGPSKNLYTVPGGIGAASTVKMINQLLAGVHIAAAAEAMAFAAKLGLDTRAVFDIIKGAAGWSWMFENRVPAMLDGDWFPHSALSIFVKDLGIVLDESKRLVFPATMSAAAHQLYLFGASKGWSNEADSGVVRVWESLTGVSVSAMAGPKFLEFKPKTYPSIVASATLSALPPVYASEILETIQERIKRQDTPVLVILDDDPTGTQTCHDIAVLTCWNQDTLQAEFKSGRPGFFILTNSRALPPVEAKQLIITICKEVVVAANKSNKDFQIVLRGDSTLRGHIPTEPEAVEEVLGQQDAWIIAPFFSQGGRLTIDDVHYVRENETLVPAAETPFAQDATFGYRSSNLRDYILEKCGQRFNQSSFTSITLEDIRLGGPQKITEKLLKVSRDGIVIVNAVEEQDMYVFAAGLLDAEAQGKKYLNRTGAAFVSARLGIQQIAPLSLHDLGMQGTTAGGMIVAGSYVPKTTAQLKVLREKRADKLNTIELDVETLISSEEDADKLVSSTSHQASELISQGKDVLIMTSRKLITGGDGLSSLKIGSTVAKALVGVIQGLTVRPRYLIAKGGITSSDAATKGLNIKRAMVVGQAAPGVPLWRCDEPTSRYAGIPYVVFPGNVGSDDTLAELVTRWSI